MTIIGSNQDVRSRPAPLKFLGYQRIAAQDASTAGSLTIPTGSNYMVVQTIGNNLRYRIDGSTTAPTATTGGQIADGDSAGFPLDETQLTAVKVISETGTAEVIVQYFNSL